MWFKNLTLFRTPRNWAITVDQLINALAKRQFTTCNDYEFSSSGFSPVRDFGLAHSVNNQILLNYTQEKRLLPASVINEATQIKSKELEESQGFPPGRKAMKELKERVTEELLPQAFRVKSHTGVWIDPVNGWLGIDSGTSGKADDIVKDLFKCIDALPLLALKTTRLPVQVLTDWLCDGEASHNFTVDQAAELVSSVDKSKIRYQNTSPQREEVSNYVAEGKQCKQLAITWNDKISFVLTDSLTIKRITQIGIVAEGQEKGLDATERFESDFALMAGEFAQLLDGLMDVLEEDVSQYDWVNN